MGTRLSRKELLVSFKPGEASNLLKLAQYGLHQLEGNHGAQWQLFGHAIAYGSAKEATDALQQAVEFWRQKYGNDGYG